MFELLASPGFGGFHLKGGWFLAHGGAGDFLGQNVLVKLDKTQGHFADKSSGVLATGLRFYHLLSTVLPKILRVFGFAGLPMFAIYPLKIGLFADLVAKNPGNLCHWQQSQSVDAPSDQRRHPQIRRWAPAYGHVQRDSSC